MKNQLLLVTLFFSTTLYSQGGESSETAKEVSINIVKEMQSPAATLVGISNTEIAKVNTPTEFMSSLNQASKDFSSIPVNFAFDIAPFQFANSKLDSNYNDVKSNWTLSFAWNNNDVKAGEVLVPNTAIGFGTKTKLFRQKKMKKKSNSSKSKSPLEIQPRFNNSEIEKKYKQKKKELKAYEANLDLAKSDRSFSSAANELSIKVESIKDELKDLSKERSFFDLLEKNLKVDLNAAVSYNLKNRSFDSLSISRSAIWINAEYTDSSGLSALAIARYNYMLPLSSTDEKLEDMRYVDFGIKVNLVKKKIDLSLESLYNFSEIEDRNDRWKWILNFSYEVTTNTHLGFSFGKDYGGVVQRDGNLINALNFITGFQNKKEIDEQQIKAML